MSRRTARLQLLDPVTGNPIEEVDVNTRAELIEIGDTTLDQKLLSIDQQISSLNNGYNTPSVSITNSEDAYLESGSGDYTITFNFSKGRDNITSIKIYDNASVYTCTSGDLATINMSGSLSLNYNVSDDVSLHNAYAIIKDGTSEVRSETIKITYVYPIYYGKSSTTAFTSSIITSSNKQIVDSFISAKFTANNEVIFFASPYEPTSVIDQNGINIMDALFSTDVVVSGLDGYENVYHVYYTNKITINSYKISFYL
jgi:hypothetical protein